MRYSSLCSITTLQNYLRRSIEAKVTSKMWSIHTAWKLLLSLLNVCYSSYHGFNLRADLFTSIIVLCRRASDCGTETHKRQHAGRSRQWKRALISFLTKLSRLRGTCFSAYGFPFQSPVSPCKYQNTVIQSDPAANFPETIGGVVGLTWATHLSHLTSREKPP